MKLPALILFTILILTHFAYYSLGQDMVITLSDTIYGEVQIDVPGNRIQVKRNNSYQFLVASQVQWIRQSGKNYCVAAFGEQSRFLIFEVLSKGAKTLLYREGVKFNPYDEESFPPFFVLENRSAYALGARKDVLSVFGAGEKEVKEFVKNEGLSFFNKEDLSRIFDYFNKAD